MTSIKHLQLEAFERLLAAAQPAAGPASPEALTPWKVLVFDKYSRCAVLLLPRDSTLADALGRRLEGTWWPRWRR
jgi:hypothetical protein